MSCVGCKLELERYTSATRSRGGDRPSTSELNIVLEAPSAVKPLTTPDGRYIVVRGRLWRTANPNLPAELRATLVSNLMEARRAVKAAKGAGDSVDLASARARVNAAKVALGERGPVWWDDNAEDFNRRLVKNTPYADWYAKVI